MTWLLGVATKNFSLVSPHRVLFVVLNHSYYEPLNPVRWWNIIHTLWDRCIKICCLKARKLYREHVLLIHCHVTDSKIQVLRSLKNLFSIYLCVKCILASHWSKCVQYVWNLEMRAHMGHINWWHTLFNVEAHPF